MVETIGQNNGQALPGQRLYLEEVLDVEFLEEQETYDIQVEKRHRFFANGFLVHNCLGKFHPHGDCLAGETLVPLLSGKTVSIKSLADLAAGPRWILALDERNQKFVPALAHSWREGKRSRRKYHIHLSTGDTISSTGNHPFYAQDLGWTRADELKVGQHLTGGFISDSKYRFISSYLDANQESLHRLVGYHTHGSIAEDETFHHANENTVDNRPSNLKVMTREDHAEHHGDFHAGLEAGRERMFNSKGKLRKAIFAKNSTLLRIHNENLWLLKAVKAIRLLVERKKKLTESNYESLRGEIYNLTKISRLSERGVTFKHLCEIAPEFSLDTSSARGLTKNLRKADKASKRNQVRVLENFLAGGQPNLLKALVRVFEELLTQGESSCISDLPWSKYEAIANKLAGCNAGKVLYSDVASLKEYFKIDTVAALCAKLPGSHLSVITGIDVEELDEPEIFYDFTVDGHENMIVQTGESGNFVVAHNSSIYSALVGMAGTKFQGKSEGWATRNTSTPLFEGKGNWGDFVDSAAASRYTEVRLSKFSDLFMLDPDYLAVMDMVPNYDESEKVPVILPAKVPVILLNGFSSIAVGVAGACPPFALKGVLHLTRQALRGQVITDKDCVKHLVPDYPYGGECISGRPEMLEVMRGKGSAVYVPSHVVDHKERTITFTSVCPGLMSPRAIQTFLEKLASNKRVSTVDDDTDKKGVRYVVQANRGVVGAQLDNLAQECIDIGARSERYDIGITMRQPDGSAKFKMTDVMEIFTLWASWRLEIEIKVLHRLIELQQKKLDRQNLLLLAVDNLDTLVEALRVKVITVDMKINGEIKKVDGGVAYLIKVLKLDLEKATAVFSLQLRQLRVIERASILDNIKAIKTEIKRLQVYMKDPKVRVLENLDEIEKTKL